MKGFRSPALLLFDLNCLPPSYRPALHCPLFPEIPVLSCSFKYYFVSLFSVTIVEFDVCAGL